MAQHSGSYADDICSAVQVVPPNSGDKLQKIQLQTTTIQSVLSPGWKIYCRCPWHSCTAMVGQDQVHVHVHIYCVPVCADV